MTVFQVVTTSDEGMTAVFTEDMTAWAEDNFAEITGTHANLRNRPELQGHPKLRGYVGPCWGGYNDQGDPIIRYEDAETYAQLSS